MSYTVTSKTIQHTVIVEFDGPRDFEHDSAYAGVPRTYRPVKLIITYYDDDAPGWKLTVRQVRRDGTVNDKLMTTSFSRWEMSNESVKHLMDEIAADLDPRREQ